MKVPLSWLREYVDLDLPVEELAHRLTMAGVEVGEVLRVGGWEHCYVGQVLSVRAHPQADRLSLCLVSTGSEELEVVCGAPNVAADQKVCFAKVGANLYDSHTGKQEALKAARIRGVVSQGMICSELELGLGQDHEGIIILPDEAPVGLALDQYLGDNILDLELTPNRLDCLSIRGVAHEVAALTGKMVREPDLTYPEEGLPVDGQVSISIADPDLCHRYTATLIHGVRIGPSPHWLQERLTRAGLRPINNVVDATNYVMLEFNQPLHAFDFRRVQQSTVVVRRARIGETLVTLDGVERRLDPEVLVIADAQDAIGIGGVIGGAGSEIGTDTTAVLLESATFNGYNNRQTAQSQHLRTDATLRFEKGLRPELAPIALRRATRLIHQVAGGQVAQGIIDVFPDGPSPQTVSLTQKRLKKVLGMEIDGETVEQVLTSLGFQCKQAGSGCLQVDIPYWRNDVGIEDDLVEEVVRIIGYDSVPTTMISTPIPYRSPAPEADLRELMKDTLAGAGVQEVISYPLVSLEYLERVNGLDGSSLPLRILNPLSSGQEYLRPTLRASLLATLAANQGHSEGPFRMFEVGNTFHSRPEELPHEQQMLALLVSGRRWATSWLEDSSLVDFFDAKGLVETVLDRLGISAAFEPAEDSFFQGGRCAGIKVGNINLGVIGEVHPAVRDSFDLNPSPVALVELDLEALNEVAQWKQRRFKTLSRYPAATRDLALLVPAGVPEGRLQDIIAHHPLVEQVELFDIYSGENIPAGTRSLAFHVYFQSHERTLTTEEVNRSLQSLLHTLEREVGASMRG